MQKELVIVYKNNCKDTNLDYIYVQDSQMHNELDAYIANHPDRQIIHAFVKTDDIIRANQDSLREFTKYCTRYGFEPTDYDKLYRDPATGHIMKFVGFLPSCRKYTCRLLDTDDGRNIKATPGHVRFMLKDFKI